MIKTADLIHKNGDQLSIIENEKVGYVNVITLLHEFNTDCRERVIDFTAHRLSFDQLIKKAQQYGFKIVNVYEFKGE